MRLGFSFNNFNISSERKLSFFKFSALSNIFIAQTRTSLRGNSAHWLLHFTSAASKQQHNFRCHWDLEQAWCGTKYYLIHLHKIHLLFSSSQLRNHHRTVQQNSEPQSFCHSVSWVYWKTYKAIWQLVPSSIKQTVLSHSFKKSQRFNPLQVKKMAPSSSSNHFLGGNLPCYQPGTPVHHLLTWEDIHLSFEPFASPCCVFTKNLPWGDWFHPYG